jgi:hypothetical protein
MDVSCPGSPHTLRSLRTGYLLNVHRKGPRAPQTLVAPGRPSFGFRVLRRLVRLLMVSEVLALAILVRTFEGHFEFGRFHIG